MAYTKNTWVDQDVERPKTYEVTNNQDGSITLTDSFGLVTELGTPVNATNMNHIEDGVAGCAIRKHNLTETFALGEWVLGGTDDDEGIYKSLIANNVGNAITDDTAWEKVEMGGGGTSRNIGEIVASTLPLTDAGLHLLDGALIDGYGIYSAFVEYIASIYDASASYFCTEAEWQSSVNTYGVCGKFVYDSVNNTVRLPKITGILEGTTDVTALGDLVEAGLPNITGEVAFKGQAGGNQYQASGAFSYIEYGNAGSDQGNNAYWRADFNASRSSSIYGNSSTVQPQTIKCHYYIVIATSTKTDIQVDIDEIATDLNSKADVDLSNISASQSAKNEIIGWGMPNWSNSISYANNTNTNTAPSDGFIMLYYVPNSGTGYFQINGQNVASCISTTYRTSACGMFVINKNDTFNITATAINDSYSQFVYKFIPMKGAN